MQPDDLARRILERGFLTSKEVLEAPGAAPPAPNARGPSRRTWLLAGGAVLCVVAGIIAAKFATRGTVARTETQRPPSPATVEAPVPPTGEAPVDPWSVRASRARDLVERAAAMSPGLERDRADEEARREAAECFHAAPGRPEAAQLLWEAHDGIRLRLAALGAPALAQRVQALATLREAMSQTLARNPTSESCKRLVAHASLELGDAVVAAGQREKAVELWIEAAVLDADLLLEVDRRKTRAGR